MFCLTNYVFWMCYLIKVGFKLQCTLRVNKNDWRSNRLLQALSKPQVVHECLEETNRAIIGKWWLQKGLRAPKTNTTVTGIRPGQFILMALSAIATDAYRSDPSRDHTPTRRSNHQHLWRRLQHSGGHGGGRLLPCKHNKSLGWQDRLVQFRLINARRTRRKWFECQESQACIRGWRAFIKSWHVLLFKVSLTLSLAEISWLPHCYRSYPLYFILTVIGLEHFMKVTKYRTRYKALLPKNGNVSYWTCYS